MSDWMTIRVELVGRPGEPLVPAPGRVMLASSEHTFAELADAIDNAFGRWDLTPVHEFAVEGRRLLPGADPDDEAATNSEEVALGDVALKEGTEFSYLFDLGEGWEHDCRVEEVGVDPESEDGEPDLPVPVFGWGAIPDQYGRDSDSDDEDPDDEDDDDDASGDVDWDTVAAAVPQWDVDAPADELTAAAARLRTELQLELPPFDLLFRAAGLDADELPPDDDDLWLTVAAAAIQPATTASVDAGAEAVWSTLEPADWAGLVIGLVRGDVGQAAEPEVLAHLIESCPDIETDPLVDEDRDAVIEALDNVVTWWQALGALDDDRRLTALGRWGIPRALQAAWA